MHLRGEQLLQRKREERRRQQQEEEETTKSKIDKIKEESTSNDEQVSEVSEDDPQSAWIEKLLEMCSQHF